MEQGDDVIENESNYEQRLEAIRRTEAIDQKFGYQGYTEPAARDAWLVNVQPSEMVDDQTKVILSVCDFYFLQENGDRFKISYPFRPYLFLMVISSHEHQACAHLLKKYHGIITADVIEKEDLDLKNHLSGLKRKVIKVSFPSMNELAKFKKDLMPIIRKNQEREERTTAYTSLLAKHLGGDRDARDDGEILEKIVDIREHDLPYQMRVCIDEKYFIGAWYEVIGRDASRRPSIKRHPSLIDQPEPVVLAFDIEVTKLPLKFPDSTIDEIMMISYMIDGNGFLIINRKVVADNIEDFEYTPKPEYKGVFTVFNEKDETAVIKCFFDHILRVRPSIFATYNGDSFDWPFIEARATLLGIDMFDEIGFCKDGNGDYRNTNAIHMDVFRWVKRDSYLPVGSQNLKACTKAKLRYDPVELDPEEMLPMARNDPQTLASYSVSDAVATYYLYMKYVHPFIFALCTIIPLAPDDVLRKGSGTLCEALLMVEAHHKNILFPNKKIMSGNKFTSDGHAVESETYVGGHVEAIESGVYRADIPCRFRMIPATLLSLKKGARKALHDALVFENSLKIEHIADFDEVCSEVEAKFDDLLKHPNRNECPKIYHLDVGAMYPNIILTNRLQPSAVVEDEDCIACVYNVPEAKCKRKMQWEWRGEVLPASRGEYERIFQQLENEKFGKPPRAFHALSRDERTKIEKKRVLDFCKKAYGRTHLTRTQFRYSVICQRENGFYVNTVRAFRDRRYEYKDMLKKAKAALESIPEHDVAAMKSAQGRVVLYDSLQLAHKCILNSFYGYVMRKGSRWFSMEMAGIVCHTGANLITEARKLVEQIGMPLELDTDGIWCLLPESFPENFTFHLSSGTNRSIKISYPGAMLNALVRDKFTNDQYHHLQADGSYTVTSENSIFFEVDGPYLAMILPASKEEGKKLKKRYAVFNFDGSLAELKGFEVKRRGELAMIKYFQSSVFKAFLYGKNLSEVYSSVAKEADYWLDVLFSKGEGLRDDELFDLIAENRSMTRKLEDYGEQKSTSISTAKRLAEFLGNDMVRDAGLACRFIISRKPIGAPVTERAIPLAVFNVERGIAVKYLRKWTKDSDIDLNFDIRNIIDWDYYVDRVGGTIQKIISIPAVLQGISNPVPRIPLPDWLVSKRRQRLNDRTQSKITDLFRAHGDNQSITKNLSLKSKAERDFCTESSSQEMDGARKRGHTHPSGKDKDGCDKAGDSVPAKKSCREERSVVKKTIIEDGVVEWIQYLKRKWKKMLENRKTIRQTRIGKGQNNLHSFLEKSRAHMQRERWQILQISESNEKGRITVWAMINGRMNKLLVKIPRVFYVNERESRPHSGIPVKRILPRTKPVLNLYEYSVEESRFLSKMSKLNRELCAMRIEGIYGTSTPPLFRAIVQLGCCCRVRSKMDFSFTGLSVDDLERISGPDFEYLPSKSVRSLFFFEHHQDSRCVMAIFNTALTEAIVIVVNRGDISLPSLSTIYATEQERLSNTNPDFERRGEIKFRVSQCSTMREADRIVQKYLREIRQTDSFPTVIMVQSNEAFSSLTRRISILADYPLVRIHSKEPTNLFNQIDWQRIVFRRLIQHFFNSFIYLQVS
ncbi:hypothetical protein AB6A40_000734 [Gnathostoma spinigerum]|uniref:DNA polymerase epsilon catalytic subunit n=1 Tax=Gnathostoma spinigerum TaxID=75299 RepID=A0ABD6ECJ3_9BILA